MTNFDAMMTIIDKRMIIIESKARAIDKKMRALNKKMRRMNAMMRSYFIVFGVILMMSYQISEFEGFLPLFFCCFSLKIVTLF